MQKKLIIIGWFCICSLSAEPILEKFLLSFSEYQSLKNIEAKQEIFAENGFNKTLIEKARFNVGYSRFDKENIDVAFELRLYPKTFSQIDKEEEIYNLSKNRVDISYENTKSKALKRHYDLLINTNFQKKSYQNMQNLLDINKRQLDLALSVTDSVTDVINLAKIKKRVQKIEYSLLKKKQKYYNNLLKIRQYIPDVDIEKIDNAFEKRAFISVQEIISFINKNKNDFNKTSLKFLEKEQIEVLLAKDKMELSKIADGFHINSIDLKYENENVFKKSLSVGLSLEKTWSGSNILKSVNEKIKFLDAQNKLNKKEEDLKYQILSIMKEIDILNSNILYAKESIENDSFFQAYQEFKNSDPLKLLVFENNHLEIKRNLIKTKKELYSKFIDLLYRTNNLTINSLLKK